jgi:hypothetical protein
MIRIAVAILFVLHGLIHLLGSAKAFGYADLPQLSQTASQPIGVLWLTAALLCLAAAAALFRTPRWWWAVGALAVLSSQAAIVMAWPDAMLGTVANMLLLVAVLYGFASRGPLSLRAEYEHRLERTWPWTAEQHVTDADLAPLPDPVQRYLRRADVVGQPRVNDFRATWTGRIRSGPDSDWMTFTADQLNILDTPRRFFLMDARMKGLPVDVLHAFDETGASMRVRLLSVRSMVDARGAEFTHAETATFFNDLCVCAPSALVFADVTWQPIDAHRAVGHFTLGVNTITAELSSTTTGTWSTSYRRTGQPARRTEASPACGGRLRCATTPGSAPLGSPPRRKPGGTRTQAPGPTGSSNSPRSPTTWQIESGPLAGWPRPP